MNVGGYKIVNTYKPPPMRLYKHLTHQRFLTPVFTLVILTNYALIGNIITNADVDCLLNEHTPIISPFFTIQRTNPTFITAAETLALTQILFSAAVALMDAYPLVVF